LAKAFCHRADLSGYSDADGDTVQDLADDVLFQHAGILGLGLEREAMGQGGDGHSLHVFGNGIIPAFNKRAGLRNAKQS